MEHIERARPGAALMHRLAVHIKGHAPHAAALAFAGSAVQLREDDQDRITALCATPRTPNTWRVYRSAVAVLDCLGRRPRHRQLPPPRSSSIAPSRAPHRRPCASTGPGSPPWTGARPISPQRSPEREGTAAGLPGRVSGHSPDRSAQSLLPPPPMRTDTYL